MNKLFILQLCFISFIYSETINVPADTASIQGGISMAEDGDTVLVAPYQETCPFKIRKGK